jgi:predicted secreted protein
MNAIGTKLYRWNSSSQWEALAEVNSISGPGMSRETIEVTSLDSEDGYREYIGGLREGGTIQLSMNFTRANYNLMKADFESDELQNYKIVIPDTDETTLEFEGFVMELPANFEPGDKITMDVQIQISGKVELFDGSSGG